MVGNRWEQKYSCDDASAEADWHCNSGDGYSQIESERYNSAYNSNCCDRPSNSLTSNCHDTVEW